MNGFAEAAIGLAFLTQLAALDTVLALHFLPSSAATPAAQHQERPATQKLMRNPWERPYL